MKFLKNNCCNCKLNIEEVITHICKFETDYFFNKKWVVGVGLGYKVTKGFYTCEKCIQVFVIKKLPICKLSCRDIIPLRFKGIKTDVIETGAFTACSLDKRIRPVEGGYNIGCANNVVNGTAGCLVTNGVRKFILCTNHVLAGGNTIPLETPIVQPSYLYEGKVPQDVIAKLYQYVPLRYIEGGQEPINLSDAAIGELTVPTILSPKIALIGSLNCVKNAKLNSTVQKVGSASELTRGVVTSINASILVNFRITGKIARFSDIIVTGRMSEPGDSGAILVNKSKCAVGMLFCESNTTTNYCNLNTVLSQLGVTLVTK